MNDEQPMEPAGAPAWPAPLAEPEGPRPKRTRGVLAALLVVVVLIAGSIGVVALTGSPAHKAAALVLRDAPGQTTGSGSAKVSMVVHISAGSNGMDFARIDGATDFARKTSELTFHVGPIEEEMRAVDGMQYIRASVLTLRGGRHWVSLSPADVGTSASDIAKAIGNNDPSSGLQYLSAIAGKPTEVGHETVDGVDTTHYTFTLDLQTLLEKLADTTSRNLHSDLLRRSLQTLQGVVDLRHLAGQAWIDKQGRVRRFHYEMNIPAGTKTVNETFDMRFTDFGTPVTVSAPPASDTVRFRDVPDYFKQLQAAAHTAASGA